MSTAAPSRALPPGVRPIIAGLMLTMFLVALDGTIVSTAIPSIVGNLGGFSLYAWVPAIYLLTTAVSTPIYGKLSDLYGRKRILFFGIALFLAGSMACGAAPSMIFLIVFRAVQGLGAGAVQPVTMTIIGDLFTLEQRARVQGFFSSVWGISSVVGPLLGGFLVDSVGWRWIFYLNLPFGLFAVIMLGAYFHEHLTPRQHTLDIMGATLLTTGLSALLLLLIEGGQAWPWFSLTSAVLAAVTVVSLALFVRQERLAPEPAVPLDLFRSRIIGVSAIGAFFAGAVLISVSFEVPLYVQGVLGQDALHAGLALAPMSLGWPIAGTMAGRLVIRFGYRSIATIGMVLCAIGSGLLLTLGQHESIGVVAGYSFVIGVGLGLSSNPLLIAVQSAVTWSRRGMATAGQMFVRSFGSVVGLAVMGVIVGNAGVPTGAATNQSLDVGSRHHLAPSVLAAIQHALFVGIHQAYFAPVVAAVAGLVAVTLLPGGSAQQYEAREAETADAPAVRAASRETRTAG